MIAGLIIASVCVLAVLGLDARNGTGFAIGFVMTFLPVPLLISVVLVLDRLEPEPWRTLMFAFAWGAGVAVLAALVLYTFGYVYVIEPRFGDEDGQFVTAVISVPIVEEALKGAVLCGFLWFRRNELDGLTDGIIYAATVALGFAMMENITYYIRALEQDNLEAVFVLRGLISPLGHSLFTSMTGLGIAYAAVHRGATRVVAPILGLLGAILLHALWNGSTYFGLGALGIVYLFDFCILVGLVVIVVAERRRTVQLIVRYLPPYRPSGLVTDQDIRMLGTLSTRRNARRWARQVGGAKAVRAVSDYQLAATELALLGQRRERGAAGPVWFEYRQQILLNLMYMARQAFLRRRDLPPPVPWAGDGRSGFYSPF